MRSNCKAFPQLVIKRERPLVGGTISGLVVLHSIREQAEQARGSKPVSSTLHGLCISSPLQVVPLLEFLPWLPLMINCGVEL